MISTFAAGQDEIARRVKQFQTNYTAYHAPDYKEAHARQELIDWLFIALGWDVRNERGAAPHRREVILEASQDVEGHASRKAPDYAFRFGADTLFYVEAKKPGVAIKTAASAAFQLRRYAWSAKLALSRLTDFEELAVYDCRVRPSDQDKARVARINYYTWEQYADVWREIWDVYSREAVERGSFDQYVQAAKGKRGTTPVDAEFLDRIIFLRMAEDRGIEPYARLQQLAQTSEVSKTSEVYQGLLDLCRQADAKYNSGLFDFSARGDRLTPKLIIHDKVLKPILSDLYYPHPYEFSVMPKEILGNVYEQFLGKVIRLTPSHQARVEEKPEVKKAGGVRYTPAYIVDNIVALTIGQWITEHVKPTDRVPLPPTFRVLDISCGSGSFALGAYQYLLDYYLQWYVDHLDPSGLRNPKGLQQIKGEWRLTIAEKKRILTAHIFGVDIDRQAVEVTKLSLLLKVLEGESDETLQLKLFDNGRALPNLDANIKCGNSLIGPDYFTGQLLPDADEMKRVNPFDWQREFPQVFGPLPASPVRKQTRTVEEPAPSPVEIFSSTGEGRGGGGFDVPVGNPPYIRIQVMKEWAPLEVEAYKRLYASASAGNYDIYVVFVEKALSLLNQNGRLGFILPHKFFNAQYGEPLRDVIAKGRYLSHVVHFGDQQIFAGVTTYTCLMFLDKAGRDACHFVKVDDLAAWRKTGTAIEGDIPAATITAAEWNFTVGQGADLFDKLNQMPAKLGEMTRIFQGLVTGADKVFVLEQTESTKNLLVKAVDHEGTSWMLERDILKPFIYSITVATYKRPTTQHWIIFPYRLQEGKATLISAKEIADNYPQTWEYLKHNGHILREREGGKWNHGQWYAFGRTQNLTQMDDPKLIVQVISLYGRYAYDDTGIFFTGGGNGPYYGVRWQTPDNPHSLHYLQALLSSRLLDWYLRKISSPFRGGYWSYGKRFIEQLPIRTIDFNHAVDKAAHDRMAKLVDTMLQLHPRLAAAKSAHDRDLIQRQIDATDQQIDALVYQLYGLTEEEIKIVEGA